MTYLVIHRATDRVMATIDRDDIPWCSLREIPAREIRDYYTIPIAPTTNVMNLPRKPCWPKEEYPPL